MGVNISWRLVSKPHYSSDTPCPVYLRIRRNDGSSESTINTGVEVPKSLWKDGTISKKHNDYTNILRTLIKVRKDVESIITELEENDNFPHPKLVRKEYENIVLYRESHTEQGLSYQECWKRFLHKKKVETTFYTHRMYVQLYKRLEEFSKDTKVEISFEYLVSENFETDFKQWSWEVRGHKNSFVRKNLTSIKSFLNYCKSNRFIDLQLREYKKPKVLERQEVIHLKREEVLRLSRITKYDYVQGKSYRKEITQIRDVNRFDTVRYFNNWELVKDLMVFMCVTGCRWSDLHHMTWDSQNFDNETFTWENQKTKKYTTVPIDPIGVEILKKYGRSKSRRMKLFPKYSSVHFNENIKKIFLDLNMNRLVSVTKMMGTKSVDTEKVPLYEVISSHVGRRTFIMNLIEKGSDYKTIMTMTGHSDVKSLMKYISVDEGRIEFGRNLYSEKEGTETELVKLFQKLTPEKKSLVIGMIKSMI